VGAVSESEEALEEALEEKHPKKEAAGNSKKGAPTCVEC